MQRLIAAILAFITVLNGVMMLFAGPSWYANVLGVPETGPFNSHFVQDIGAAFLVAGLALAAPAWRPAYWRRSRVPPSLSPTRRSISQISR